MSSILKSSIESMKGIGPKKAALFKKGCIETLEDLLYFFPRSYQDRREAKKISDVHIGEDVLLSARVLAKKTPYYGRKSPLTLAVEDETGSLNIVFFNGKFLANLFDIGEEYTFYGRVSENYKNKQLINPEFSK